MVSYTEYKIRAILSSTFVFRDLVFDLKRTMIGGGTKFSLLLSITLSLFLVSQCYDLPLLELQRCQIKCLERDYSTAEEHVCMVLCQETYMQERANSENGQNPRVSPEQKYKQCQRRCGDRGQEEERRTCRQRCTEEYSKEREREREGREHGGEGNLLGKKREEKKERKEEGKHEKNPYFFEGQRFESRFKTEEGHFRVLQRFSEKSELLNGIDNYRLAVFEANPSTLLLPHHCDADAVFVVTYGQGIINIVHQKRRETFKLQRGDAIKVPAGSIVYIINYDNNEKLQIVTFAHPLNTPGHFEEFFGAGSEYPQSFYRVFSRELRQAAFNIRGDRYEGFFEKQENGGVIKLCQEQIRALTQDQQGGSSSQGQWGESGSSSQGQWGQPGSSSEGQEGQSGSSSQEQGGESGGPFNVLQLLPQFANELGQFFEASPDTTKQLRQLGFSVAFMNINQGAMIVPYHNTRSTIVVVVVRGKGKFEMACPHVGKSSQDSDENKEEKRKHDKRSGQFQKVSATFSQGDVFIIPTAHPISIVASEDESLQLAGFGVNARNNSKHFLAGSDNIWNQIPSDVKAISFASKTTEVDEVFGSQQKAYFVPGPKRSQQQEEEKGHSMASMMDLLGFI